MNCTDGGSATDRLLGDEGAARGEVGDQPLVLAQEEGIGLARGEQCQGTLPGRGGGDKGRRLMGDWVIS